MRSLNGVLYIGEDVAPVSGNGGDGDLEYPFPLLLFLGGGTTYKDSILVSISSMTLNPCEKGMSCLIKSEIS